MLARRPALAVFSAVYRFVAAAEFRATRMWQTVRQELRLVMALAPVLFSCFTAGFATRVVASDASTTGFGISAARVPLAMVERVASQRVTFDGKRLLPAVFDRAFYMADHYRGAGLAPRAHQRA